MASRGLSDAQERKQRSLYELLDNCQNKKAVQLADKILKKQKDFLSIKGLKGLALLRMNRRDDAAAVVKEVRAVAQHDESTVQALTLYYKESSQPEELCAFYETLVQNSPANEELLAQLFMSYVRIGNLKKQQQTAVSLHKHFPTKNPYYFWGVMSVYLQALSSDLKMGRTVFLPLAERMVEKTVKDGKMEAEAEVRLYLMILIKLEKFEKALEVIRSNLGEMFHGRDELVLYEISILEHMKSWPTLVALYRSELVKNPDNWSFWSGYMDALGSFLSSEESAESASELTVASLQQFIADRHEALSVDGQTKKSRNIDLARLELRKRVLSVAIFKDNSQSITIPALYDLLVKYVETYGDKPMCFSDVRPYITLLSEDEQKSLVTDVTEKAKMATVASQEQDGKPAKIAALTRECLAVQLSRFTSQHAALAPAERRSLASDLMRHHADGLPLGEDLLSTDVQYADTFPLLAAHLLVDNDPLDTGCEADLFRAIVLLEHALAASPSSSQLQLYLIKLYYCYGAYDPAALTFNKLQIKHFLLETIGYIWSGPVFGLGYFRSGLAVAQMMLGMNTETGEFLITAYRSGTFHKVIEIMEFREDLQKSLQLATASALYQSTELLSKCHTIDEVVLRYQKTSPMVYPHAVAAQWRDLRDVRVMTSWSPERDQLSDEQKTSSYELESLWVELRTCLNRSVCCVCSVAATFAPTAAPTSNGSTVAAAADTLDDTDASYAPPLGSAELAAKARAMDSGGLAEAASLVKRIDELCTTASEHPGLREHYPVQGPHPTGLPKFLDGNHGSIHTAALVVAMTTHNLIRPEESQKSSGEVSQAEQTDAVRKSLDAIGVALDDTYAKARAGLSKTENDTRVFTGTGLEPLVYVVESLSTVVYLLSCANYFVNSSRGTSKKARKKKPTGVVGELLDLLTGAHVRITAMLEDIRIFVRETHKGLIDGQLLSVPQPVLDQMPGPYEKARDAALKHISDSHQQAVDAILEVVNEKISAFSKAKL